VKIDSTPQQAAIYIDRKEYGIEGYTPTTLKLPKGTYTIILELPGFKPVERAIQVTRSQAFVFTMERAARPAVIEVRSASNDSATGGQVLLDGAAVGVVPARIDTTPGSHLVEVKKTGFLPYRNQVTTNEGETRSEVVDLQAEAKKGSILVTADVAGADVYVDGQRRDSAPALIDGLIEGPHTVEVRKDPLPPWKQVVNVIGNQQVKIDAKIGANAPPPPPQGGSLRIVSSAPSADVYIDGEMRGQANQEIKGLPPGQHIIEVRAKGFASQVVEVTIAAGEQRIARVELQPEAAKPVFARLRVVTPVPDAEVFIDGASVGRAPIDRNDLAPGKHYVVVQRLGFAQWKREVDLDPNVPVTLSAELSASGTIKVLANVPNAEVLVDGVMVGKTPATVGNISSGDHMIQVRAPGFMPVEQALHIEGGDEKVLSAQLQVVRTGPSPEQMAATQRGMSSFSAVTVEPGKFTADFAGGFIPFAELRLTVGAFRKGSLGLDAGVGVKTIGYFTEAGAHAKFQWLRAGPAAIGIDLYIGGGGGPTARSSFVFELGVPISLLFANIVRFTMKPYLQAYSDRNCPSVTDIQADMKTSDMSLYKNEPASCKAYDGNGKRMMDPLPVVTNLAFQDAHQDPRDRFGGARLMLQANLEIAVHQVATIFFLLEGDPIGQRQSLTGKFIPYLPDSDPQIYGKAGVTFKF
jgi:hypothetical protein